MASDNPYNNFSGPVTRGRVLRVGPRGDEEFEPTGPRVAQYLNTNSVLQGGESAGEYPRGQAPSPPRFTGSRAPTAPAPNMAYDMPRTAPAPGYFDRQHSSIVNQNAPGGAVSQ